MQRVSTIRARGLALALMAALAGCGGGSGGGTASTPVPVSTPTPTPTATATPTPVVATTPTPTPTLPAASFQTAEYNRSDGPAFHQAIPAWQTGATGQGVTLGIVDSGIDTTNPEFAGRIAAASRDVVGTRTLGSGDSHGTQVALTAAAARNGTGIMGIAYEATILMARADSPGTCTTTDGCSFSDSAIAAGIDLAVANGARVINISLGGSGAAPGLARSIANATAAGAVIVVSAGNDAATDPDNFAATLRAAGSGKVIIAGSVNDQGVISSFSNHAGSQATWFLTAQGERVCCVYENGQIKTTTDASGQTYVTVVSGTSFAAPQIAGAAALLIQAFPNLTGAQVVDLLLSSATDAGTAGTDAIYGRGILNIANAFAAKGTLTLAGTSTALVPADTTLVTSAAMGDAGSGSAITTTVLDSYRRAYTVDLGRSVRRSGVAPRLAMALLDRRQAYQGSAGPLALSFTAGRSAAQGLNGPQWGGQLQLSCGDAQAARVLAGRVVARLGPTAQGAFGFAQGADGLMAQLRGATQPAFLVAPTAQDDFGFARTRLLSSALRQQFGRLGVTVAADSGTVQVNPVRTASVTDADPLRRLAAGYQPRIDRLGVVLDRRLGGVDASLGAHWLGEERTVLGARIAPSLAPRGADSLFVDLGARWQFGGAGWQLSGLYRRGFTQARAGSVVAGASRLSTSGWTLDLARSGVLSGRDELALRLAQPLRVERGGLVLHLPDHWDYKTGMASVSDHRINLAPSGRELDAELAWRGPLGRGLASASLFWRRDPGHIASLPDEQGLAASWTVAF